MKRGRSLEQILSFPRVPESWEIGGLTHLLRHMFLGMRRPRRGLALPEPQFGIGFQVSKYLSSQKISPGSKFLITSACGLEFDKTTK